MCHTQARFQSRSQTLPLGRKGLVRKWTGCCGTIECSSADEPRVWCRFHTMAYSAQNAAYRIRCILAQDRRSRDDALAPIISKTASCNTSQKAAFRRSSIGRLTNTFRHADECCTRVVLILLQPALQLFWILLRSLLRPRISLFARLFSTI